MSGSRESWRFPVSGVRDSGGTGPHPLSGLPLDLVSQIGTDGASGINYYFNHFNRWEGPVVDAAAPGTGGWICTSVDGGGDAAESVDVLDSATYGILRIITNNGDNDNTQIQLNGSAFKYVAGKRLWFAIRCAPQDANDGELGFGLIIETDTDLVNTLPTDGLFFEKAETATAMTFHARKNGSSASTALAQTAMADDIMHTYAFHVDVDGNVYAYVDGELLATVAAGSTKLPDDEDLTLAIQVQTGAAATRYLDIDYVLVAQEK